MLGWRWAGGIGGGIAVVLVVLGVRSLSPSSPTPSSVAGPPGQAGSLVAPVEPSAGARAAAPPVGTAAGAVKAGEPSAAALAEEAAEPPSAVAAATAGPRTPESLLAALASSDPFVVLDAADGLAARKVTRAIPRLAAMDIRQSAESAPSIIHALGGLAGVASGQEHRTATDRLLELLSQEKARRAGDSPGNILALYEALGLTHDAKAASALEVELTDANVTIPARTVVVQSLEKLSQPTSRAAIVRLQHDLASLPPVEGFDAELRSELAAAAVQALKTLP